MKTYKSVTLLLMITIVIMLGCERKVTETTVVSENSDCFTCHPGDGALEQAEGEWRNSVHASGSNVDYTNRGGSDCTKCHDHQGFVQFLATQTLPEEPFSTVSAIGCFTCHQPHEKGNFNLRTQAAVTLANGVVFDHGRGNLCVSCHLSRKDVGATVLDSVKTSGHWGPHHGPQGDMVQGTNGYEYSGYTAGYEGSTHATALEDACADCHMGNVKAHDGYAVGGHSFNMRDTVSGTMLYPFCADCHTAAGTDKTYDYTSIVDYDMNSTMEGMQTEIDGLIDSLRVELLAASLISGSDSPLSQSVLGKDTVGAIWNFRTILEDRSRGVHNFKYTRHLLLSSYNYMKSGNPDGAPPLKQEQQASR